VALPIMVGQLTGMRLAQPTGSAAARAGTVLDNRTFVLSPLDCLLALVEPPADVQLVALEELRLDAELAVLVMRTSWTSVGT
jgi:hypothetical protein